VICRAGATSISEIQATCKPSILIPSPNVAENHQYYNALELKNNNCASLIQEKDLNYNILLTEINNISNTNLKQEYIIESRGLVVLFPEPANQKAEAIMKSQQMTLQGHEATLFTEEDLDDETLVLTVEESQKWKIVSEYENVKHVYTLNEYIDDEREVKSAHGQPLVVYGENFELLKELILKLADKLNEEGKNE
jgi:protein-tyrosine-phosphatase